jgi:phosphatidylserine/phosphatidylglycerophosphate/cardiolipin synthase-like enzyme
MRLRLARISHTFSDSSHTLHDDLAAQMGEAVLLEHCPRPSEQQSQPAERRSVQKKCGKFRLACIFVISFFFLSNFSFADEGNEIIVTDNGLEMFHWDLDFVRAAQESIEISAVFLGGEIAQQLLKTLETRLEEVPGLNVYILTTPTLLETENLVMIEHLHRRFPHQFHLEHASTIVTVYPDVTGIDNHIKFFVVDEKYFSAGGTNLDDTQCSEGTWTPPKNRNKSPSLVDMLPSGARDQDIVGRGSLAVQLRQMFFKMYAQWEHFNKTGFFEKDPERFQGKTRYYPITAQASVERFENSEYKHHVPPEQIEVIMSGPHQQHNPISQEYVRLIQEAKEEIILAHLYFCPVDSIFQALLEAVNRGVRLSVLTNGLSDISPGYIQFFSWANRLHYVPLFYGKTFFLWEVGEVAKQPIKKVQIYEYYVKDILLHKKIMIVDGKTSIVGSYNFGKRSEFGDYEMILRIDSSSIAAAIKQVYAKDLTLSNNISSEQARLWYFDPVITCLGELQKRFHSFM